jgi:SAM-dependent methyltransferase
MESDRLERVAPLLLCPGCRQARLVVVSGGGLRCGGCNHEVPDRGGWLDFLGGPPSRPSLGQRVFLNRFGAAIYAGLRESRAIALVDFRTFRDEVELLSRWLPLDGDGRPARALDVPCGQGNFTATLARRMPSGIVIGVDLSHVQLTLAARRLRRERIDNVVLLRGSALDLPLVDAAVDAAQSCGGFHLYPDVERAIDEMARVVRPGGGVAGLAPRTHRNPLVHLFERLAERGSGITFLDLDALGARFLAAGFARWRWQGRGLVGWFAAERGAVTR